LKFFQGQFFQLGSVSGVKRSSDVRDDCLILRPLTDSSNYYLAVEWPMMVNVIGCTLFFTSQYDVILTFGEVC